MKRSQQLAARRTSVSQGAGLRIAMTAVTIAALQACGGGGGDEGSVDASALSGKPGGGTATSTSTAQAIWSDLGPSASEMVIVDRRRYVFEKVESFCQSTTYSDINGDGSCTDTAATPTPGAASFYGPVQVSAVSWSCNGSPTNCDPSNQPAEPTTPPAPTLESLLKDAECAFWYGRALPPLTDSSSTTVNGLNDKGNWTATWTFTYAPLSDAAVPEKTGFGYDQLIENDSSIPVALSGYFYGESAKKAPKDPGPKYSFSMRASDDTIRVTNVSFTWKLANDPLAVPITVLVPSTAVTLEENLPHGSVDFNVTTSGNALVKNGTTSLLTFSPDVGTPVLASSLLNSDWFPGNDLGGVDGRALARVKVDAGTLNAPGLGTYDISFTATVKDLTATGTAGQVTVQRRLVIAGQPNMCNSQQ